MALAGWRERWVAWRNERLRDPAFQQWAQGFPLTRGVARRRAQGLFDLVAGFVYSQTLGVCVELGLFDLLEAGPASMATVAERLALPLDSAERLLGAAEALGLAQSLGSDRHALGPQGAALLGQPGLMPMIAHHHRLYADLADGAGLLRGNAGGGLAAYWPYATSRAPGDADPEAVSAYSALMAETQPAVAADILHAYPVGRHRCVMDVGGGEGVFLAAAAARSASLKLMLFDLPSVTERARARLTRAGLLQRSQIIGGDFLSEPIPEGADLITLIRILHDHDEAGVATLLRAARAALPADGALLVAEPMSAAPRPDRMADVYFAFYLLAMGRGRARTPSHIMGLMREAGFGRVRELRTRSPYLLRAILARP
jgi:demethylspheroidene O-methyltransferase